MVTTQNVSAGEVCSLDVAKKLGIRDTSKNNSYYITEYSDIKTFNAEKDSLDDLDAYKLCEPTTKSGKTAAPLCVLQSNAGFGFTRTKGANSSTYDRCATAECPTGFKRDPKNPMNCKKPKKKKTTVMANVVQERWYDWFMVPDYHLGNKYVRANDKNYAPCPKDSIPSYEKDPVDGSGKLFNISNKKDELDKCVIKTKYFGGKYAKSDTYCPLTWVYRAGATNKDLKNIYKDLLKEIDAKGNPNLDSLKKGVDSIVINEIYKPVVKYGFADYVGEAQTEEAKEACSMLDNRHPWRKTKANEICSTIKQLGKEKYIQRLMNDNKESENIAKDKYKRAIQACHTLFCKEEGSRQVCFPEVEQKGFDKENEKKKEKTEYVIDHETENEKTRNEFFKLLKIVLIGFVCIFAAIVTFPLIKLLVRTVYGTTGTLTGFVTNAPEKTGWSPMYNNSDGKTRME